MAAPAPPTTPPTTKNALIRGALGRCPCCGRGPLLHRYLKVVGECSACGERYGHFRADDAPPWLTIFVVAHLMVPLVLAMVRYSDLPDWLMSAILASAGLALCLLILPRAKGLFIAAIWAWRARPS